MILKEDGRIVRERRKNEITFGRGCSSKVQGSCK